MVLLKQNKKFFPRKGTGNLSEAVWGRERKTPHPWKRHKVLRAAVKDNTVSRKTQTNKNLVKKDEPQNSNLYVYIIQKFLGFRSLYFQGLRFVCKKEKKET